MKFSLAILHFCRTLPFNVEGNVLRHQLLKSGTSVGANYRAVCCGRSNREKKAKMYIVVEEADESVYWLQLLDSAKLGDAAQRNWVLSESQELVRMFKHSLGNMPSD